MHSETKHMLEGRIRRIKSEIELHEETMADAQTHIDLLGELLRGLEEDLETLSRASENTSDGEDTFPTPPSASSWTKAADPYQGDGTWA